MQCPKPGAREDGLPKEDGPEKLLRWSGSLDHVALNHALLRILRRVWKVRDISDHAMARLSGLSRSFLRRLKWDEVELSLPTLNKLCNGLKVGLEGLLELAVRVVRQAVR